ncbi:MAG TPA: hypothetical protein VK897_09410 [Anaerolineales bacterium]|nr:hypothetical protein [Anaerolineales bacterium]
MRALLLITMLLVVTACTALPGTATLPPDTAVTSPPINNMPTNEPQPDPFAPQPGDAPLTRGEAFLNEASLLIRESYPPQIALSLSGDLPTPCHELRVAVGAPDQENKIMVDVYSVVDPNTVCTQVIEPFEAQIELGTFPTGHYTVWVNGELAGEFDS